MEAMPDRAPEETAKRDGPSVRTLAQRALRYPSSVVALVVLVAVLLAAAAAAVLMDTGRDIEAAGGSWWTRPYERNVARRAVIGRTLHAVHATADGRRVWAVGEGRNIWHSADAGRTWRLQFPPQPTAPPAPRSAAADPVRWMPLPAARAADPPPPDPVDPKAQQGLPKAGPRAAANPPRPASSPVVPSPVAPAAPRRDAPPDALLSVQFDADGRIGWAVGTRGTVLATTDGGRHWLSQPSGTASTLWSVRFRSRDDVWVVGDDGTLLRSRDGGRRWAEQGGFAEHLHAIALGRPGDRNPFGIWMAGSAGEVRAWAPPGAYALAATAAARPALHSVALAPDGRSGWAVGQAGATRALADGAWSVRSPAPQALASVALAGSTAWAAGPDGLVSRAGPDRPWQAYAHPGRAITGMRAVHFSSPDQGWAVGDDGAVVHTEDAGATWHWLVFPGRPQDAVTYQALPAPIAVAAGLLSLALLVPVVFLGRFTPDGHEQEAPAERATPGLNSDQPLDDVAKDKLDHRSIVLGLASFIRNAQTDPRLCIAITAPWGQGKSSVMRMLQTELERFGYRTAWFNAWHHQQEGRPLSALFSVIGSQALPRRLVPRLWLRYRLIWKRGLAYRLLVLVTLAATTLFLTDIVRRIQRADWSDIRSAVEWKTSAQLLDRPRVVLTYRSVEALNPCAAANAKASSPAGAAAPASTASARCEPCSDLPGATDGTQASPAGIRPRAYCYTVANLLWQDRFGNFNHCQDERTQASKRCEFRSSDDLVAAIEAGTPITLSPAERKLVAGAAEPLAPPDLLPFTEKVIPILAIVLGILVTKGVSVYGLEVLKPLRLLLSPEARAGPQGKEATGIVERYRAQFGHLAHALKGRLVVFIDDLDRCREEMVGSVLEMSNYLIDVGECYVVLGADLRLVKLSIRQPGRVEPDPDYANRYLRKIIHIEVPVPSASEAHARQLVGVVDADLRPPAAPEEGRLPRLARAANALLHRFAWVGVGIAIVWLCILAVTHYQDDGTRTIAGGPTPEAVSRALGALSVASARVGVAAPSSNPEASSPAQPASAAPPAEAAPAAGHPPPPTTSVLGWTLVSTGLGLVLLVALWFARPDKRPIDRLRALQDRVTLAVGGALETYDPAELRQALGIWHAPVYLADGTPRGTKRFRNKARFFGMLLELKLKPGAGAPKPRVHTAALVALSLVWPQALRALAAGADLPPPHAGNAVEEKAAASYREHVATFGGIGPLLVEAYQGLASAIEVR